MRPKPIPRRSCRYDIVNASRIYAKCNKLETKEPDMGRHVIQRLQVLLDVQQKSCQEPDVNKQRLHVSLRYATEARIEKRT